MGKFILFLVVVAGAYLWWDSSKAVPPPVNGVNRAMERYNVARTKAEEQLAKDGDHTKYQGALQVAEMIKNDNVRITQDPFSGTECFLAKYYGDVSTYEVFSKCLNDGLIMILASQKGPVHAKILTFAAEGFKLDNGVPRGIRMEMNLEFMFGRPNVDYARKVSSDDWDMNGDVHLINKNSGLHYVVVVILTPQVP
jgi:hypothetical protein